MKSIVFFSTPAYGHVLSEEPIIRALVKKGYRVDWYCSNKFKKIVKNSGANFVPYQDDFDSLYKLSVVSANFYILMKSITEISRNCYLEYVDKIEKQKPDLIIYDSMCTFAKNIAKKLDIKSVCLCSTLAFNYMTSTFTGMIKPIAKMGLQHGLGIINVAKDEKRFRKQYALPKLKMLDLFVNKGDITLVLSPREFQPYAWSFPKSVKFVGATTKNKVCIKSEKYQKCDIYISLGTIFTENADFLNNIRESEVLKNQNTIVNVGGLKVKSLSKSMRFVSYVDQLSLLKKTDLFVNHGGINSIYDSLYCGVPQICVPQQEEQRMMAKIVQKKHLGLYLKNFNADNIDKYKKRLQRNCGNIASYSDIIKSTDGTRNAVNEIIKLLRHDKMAI